MTPSIATQAGGLLRLLRPKQWIKNAFVIAPLIFAHAFLEPRSIRNTVIAVLLFCCASSITYIINDLHDIEKDRLHPTKRLSRPLAAGTVTRAAAFAALVALGVVLSLSWLWSAPTAVALFAYLALNLAYTFFLKDQPVADIFSIAVGFVLRVYAGAVAISVPLSSWMAITTLCLALYLASIKRRQELATVGTGSRRVLDHYSAELIDRYAEMSAVGALIFYSLFVMSSSPGLTPTIPVVIFGLFRYWYVVDKLEGGESPTDVVLSDIPLALTIVIWGAICVFALLHR
jgi:4-hydroxybenzoate polyprenyltransferase